MLTKISVHYILVSIASKVECTAVYTTPGGKQYYHGGKLIVAQAKRCRVVEAEQARVPLPMR